MPASYENIPPERELAFLENARTAMEEAAEPVLVELGQIAVEPVIEEVELAGDLLAYAPDLPDDVEQYVKENDLHAHFTDAMEATIVNNTVANDAERYLHTFDDLTNPDDAGLQYLLSKAIDPESKEQVRLSYATDPERYNYEFARILFNEGATKEIKDQKLGLPPPEGPAPPAPPSTDPTN